MKRMWLRAALAGLLTAGFLALGLSRTAADDKKDVKDDAKLLQGRWNAWRVENSNGLVADCHDAIVIDGAEIQNLNGGATKGTRFKFTVDPTKDPKEIDVEVLAAGNIGEKRLAIYRVNGDVLEICWGDAKKRPTKFTGKLTAGAGSDYTIYHSDNYKPDEGLTKEAKRFEGKWAAEKGGDGAIFDGDDIQFLTPAGKGPRAKFTIDPTKDPKEIEIVYCSGSEIYKRRIGVYQLDDDKLTISLSDPDSDKRPTKLVGGDAPGAGKWFVVFKRKKDDK